MSVPSASWMRIASSGVSRCRLPSRCERNSTPSSRDLAQRRQAHHLEAAAVGQDRARPAHEAVQPAHPPHRLDAGPQREVIRVREQDVGARGRELVGRQRLHRARVPTGMNAGVSTSPRATRIRPARAAVTRVVRFEREVEGHQAAGRARRSNVRAGV